MPRTLSTLAEAERLRADTEWVRLLTWTLYRDRYGAAPTSITLRASDATRYLPRETDQDVFDRADNIDLGAAWSGSYGGAFGSLQIVNQAVRAGVVGGTDNLERYTLNVALRTDQWVEIIVKTVSAANGRMGGWLRAASPTTATGYVVGITSTAATIYKYVVGVQSTLGTVAATWATGDRLWFEAEGATLRVRKNGVVLLVVTDAASPILSGGVGLSVFVSSGALSQFEVEAWSAGNLREEYLPLVAEWGEVGDALEALNPVSAPASFDPVLSNVVPIAAGGQTFATTLALFREGTNTTGYDEAEGDLVYAWLPPGGVVGRDALNGARDDVRLYVGRVDQVD